MTLTNIRSNLILYSTRRHYAVFITMLIGLFHHSCSEGTNPVSELESGSAPRLHIKITNTFENTSLDPIARGSVRITEDLISTVSVYVFQGEEPVRLKDIRFENGIASAELPPLSGELSAFVVANEQIAAPASKQDLLKRMAQTVIGPGGISSSGMPMGSREIKFRISPKGQTNVTTYLERCHSAIYVETPHGRNNNYRISLTGEQQKQGALVSGTAMLASAGSNNINQTPGYTLSNVSAREAVAYYYPTDGNITITIQPVNTLLPPQRVVLDRNKAIHRNRKYILRIQSGATDGNTKREGLYRVTLVEVN